MVRFPLTAVKLIGKVGNDFAMFRICSALMKLKRQMKTQRAELVSSGNPRRSLGSAGRIGKVCMASDMKDQKMAFGPN